MQQFLGIYGGFELISNYDLIFTLSEIGVAFLLFMVGLEINFKHLKEVKEVAIVGALIKSFIVFAISVIITQFIGMSTIESVYVGLIVLFSSTMVIIKILSDTKQLETLHAKIVIGFLLIQDILAIIAIFVLTSLGSFSIFPFITSTIIAGLLIFVLVVAGELIWPRVFKHITDSRELLFMSAIAICFLFAIIFNFLGFSIAIGAFIAGVTLGNLQFHFEIIGRLKSLRDFFLVLFFVSLGMQLTGIFEKEMLLLLLIMTLLVLIIKFGYKKNTSFLTGLYLGNISEFSLILAAQGMALGHISQSLFTITIFLAIITIGLSEYFSIYSHKIMHAVSEKISFLESLHIRKMQKQPLKQLKATTVLIGCNRIGTSVLHKLLKAKTIPLVIDFNPKLIKTLMQQKIPYIYGDISNDEILDVVDFKCAKLIISTINDADATIHLLRKAKGINKKVVVIVTAFHIKDALELYNEKADYVLLPTHLSAEHIGLLLDKNILKALKKKKEHHIKELKRQFTMML